MLGIGGNVESSLRREMFVIDDIVGTYIAEKLLDLAIGVSDIPTGFLSIKKFVVRVRDLQNKSTCKV